MGFDASYGSKAFTGGRYNGDPEDPKNKAAQRRRDAKFYEGLADQARREAEQLELDPEKLAAEYGPRVK